jgi:hypothetical protein
MACKNRKTYGSTAFTLVATMMKSGTPFRRTIVGMRATAK